MITGSQEYQEFLASIADSYNPPHMRLRIPTDEPVYEINLNTRTVSTPSFLGVEADHESELIYFEMDRFFDFMDLSTCIGIVQFRNAKNEEYYYVIPYYDILSKSGKMIFAWDIQSPVTKYGGTVYFSFKFFKVDKTSRELLYELNTLVAKSKVLVGWATRNGANHNYNTISAADIIVNNDFINRLSELEALNEHMTIRWIEAS